MKQDELEAAIQKIVKNTDNQALVMEQLDQIRSGVTDVMTTNQTLEETNQAHDKRIRELKETNLNLYLKQGHQVNDDSLRKTDPEPMKYEDLITDMEKEV